MMATKIGSLKCWVIQVDDTGLDITLRKVKLAVDLGINLFNIIKPLKTGCNLRNKGLKTSLSNGTFLTTLDRVIRTTNVSVSVIKLLTESPGVYNTLSGFFHGRKMSIYDFLMMLGHYGSARLEETNKIHNLKLNGEFKICEQCAIAKASHKNVTKFEGWIQVPGE
jgi:hypothetical protein